MSSHELTLYHYWRSSCSWRIRWALAHKQISYKSIAVNLLKAEHKTSEYLQMNPMGTVPCLLVDGVAWTQSLAIIEWLEEKYLNRPLLPASPIDRLKVRELSLVIAADTQPLQNLGPQQYYSSDPKLRQEYAKHWIGRGLSAYEKMAARVAGSFSFGDQVTVADLCLIPQCYNAMRFEVNIDDYPTISRIYRNAIITPECEKAAPHNQPGADADAKILKPR